jgi:hypothetical protein
VLGAPSVLSEPSVGPEPSVAGTLGLPDGIRERLAFTDDILLGHAGNTITMAPRGGPAMASATPLDRTPLAGFGAPGPNVPDNWCGQIQKEYASVRQAPRRAK